MTTRTAEISPIIEIPLIVKHVRVVGFLLLLLIPLAIFGQIYVPSMLIVPADAAATARNIMASESLFRLGIVSVLLSHLGGDIAWVLVFYQLLKPVNKSMARLMVILILLNVPIALLNELNQFAILFLLHSADSLRAFTADQVHALVSLFLNLHDNGIKIAGIFWGLWLFPYGWLVYKSGFLPRFIGVLLMIGCVGYVLQSFVGFLSPTLLVYTAPLAALTSSGELLVPVWLLVMGVNVEQWEKRALASA
ncbi:MAG TPA: DUF4386 domain-containing protein [Ktedonobacteraceae bacterium]